MDGEVKKMEKTVTKEDENIRLDQWVMSVSGHSRNRVQKMMEQGLILVNGKKGKNSYRVKEQDHITIGEYQEEPMNLDPVEMNLKIVYEDEDVLVVDKENGVVVHPAPGNPSHTLVNGLLYHAKNLSDVNGEFRPGIVHRIDAYTTGLLMVAKNNEAHHFLAKQLSEKTTHRKYIALGQIPWNRLQVWRHLKPSLHIFVFNLITSIYLNLNTVMLGFMKGDSAVGFYTAGNKISHIVLSVVASLGVVLLPRCSNLVENGRMDEFAAVTRKSYRLVQALSLPSTLGLILLASPIVIIFGGLEFADASSVLAWTAPIIVFIGLSNVFGIQILYPLGKENLVIWSTVGGAVINLLLNLLLIPYWSYTGAAISTFIAELTVLFIQVLWGYRYIPFSLFEKVNANYLIASLVMAVVVFPLTLLLNDVWSTLILSTLVGGSIYAVVLWILKDSLFHEILRYAVRMIKH